MVTKLKPDSEDRKLLCCCLLQYIVVSYLYNTGLLLIRRLCLCMNILMNICQSAICHILCPTCLEIAVFWLHLIPLNTQNVPF